MKSTKTLALAFVAALAVMAVAATSALATNPTSLCKKNEVKCEAVNQYLKNTVISGTTGTHHTTPEEWAQLTTKLGSVHCESTVSGETTNGAGTEVAGIGIDGDIKVLNWANCRFGNPTSGEACAVNSVNLPYTGVFTNTGANVGTLTVTGIAGNPGATVVCGEIINCTYTVAKAVLNAEGGVAGMEYKAGVGYIEANKIALNGVGKACPTATWDAKYLLEGPNTPIYLST